ncbi:phage portal protein [Companilactobacillus bobalius]|uniref:Phage portal protein n=2 Tax=Companilactobacillus bobalius TaxID=2801451 RepID=A0A202F7S1_9LACO|nr:phage portal protein [Companilactobacillus bobalius]GEO58481.1 hypothetical protein LBO01_16100 [Companilactobacillus paralimentarius]KAE9557571.1 hypothetical protein ATN92_15575 [Companilactobacillus bobalius]KAE9563717.1 hypothetical protein ATN92_03025 [Companilactobacillus bobalius]KRK83461.1 phage portal protein, HK97 family [Companilactobacillus bobalius DSM 19674]OVE96544.1 hypothetical protein LKACC16343_02213 [Companilactobacillus bobalius]
MGFFDLFKNNEPVRVTESQQAIDLRKKQYKLFEDYINSSTTNTAFKLYAIQLCINRIANALVKCDFQTFKKGERFQGDVWYQLNIEPNQNQNAADFWNKVIYQMVMNEDGALVIQSRVDGSLIVADDFTFHEYAFKPNIYSNILVNNYSMNSSFLENEVFHLKLNNSKVKSLFDGIFEQYGSLLNGAIKNYNRSNAIKYALNIDSTFDQLKQKPVIDENGTQVTDENGTPLTEYDTVIDDLFGERLKGVFSDKDSVTPLESGLTLNDLNSTGNSKSSGSAANKTTRDISAMVSDIVDMSADAFMIPRGLLKGDTADIDGMTDNFISFCINPIAEQIEDEINRKMFGQKNVSKRTYCKIRTDKIRNYDLTKIANSAELISRIGVWSVNDILNFMDYEPIKEDWADKHIISKNYSLVEDDLKGGENNNDEGNENEKD